MGILGFSFGFMDRGEKSTAEMPDKIFFDDSCLNYRDYVHAIKPVINILLRVFVRELHRREYRNCVLCCYKFVRNNVLYSESWCSNPF